MNRKLDHGFDHITTQLRKDMDILAGKGVGSGQFGGKMSRIWWATNQRAYNMYLWGILYMVSDPTVVNQWGALLLSKSRINCKTLYFCKTKECVWKNSIQIIMKFLVTEVAVDQWPLPWNNHFHTSEACLKPLRISRPHLCLPYEMSITWPLNS